MPHYREAGAGRVLLMPVPYEPTIHYPPPDGWDDSKRDIEVSFVGSPYGQRADFLRALWRDEGIAVRIWGEPGMWRKALDEAEMARFHAGRAVYNDDYRNIIWRSRINLGFVTHANLDSFAQRWFEISGAGGFLLAERTEDGLRSFDSGTEAAFFDGVAECAAQIRRYLPDQAARAAIARAGHARAVSSGYDNNARLGVVLGQLADLLPRR
jgi:spore maturation protein CgeB